MINYNAIGRRIAKQRKKRNLTQEQMAEQLDVSESYVSRIECGKAKASLARLDEIAELLKIDIALLVSDCRNIGSAPPSELEDLARDWTPEMRESLIQFMIQINKK